jgi:hypothetical protein
MKQKTLTKFAIVGALIWLFCEFLELIMFLFTALICSSAENSPSFQLLNVYGASAARDNSNTITLHSIIGMGIFMITTVKFVAPLFLLIFLCKLNKRLKS